MNVTLTEESTRTIAVVSGEVDADNSDELREALLRAAGDELLVDCSGLTFIDSSGISELLRVRKYLVESGRSIVVVDPSLPVRRILEITGLLAEFGIDPS